MKLTPIYFVHPVYMCENNQPGILNHFWVIAFQKRGTNFSDTIDYGNKRSKKRDSHMEIILNNNVHKNLW